MMEEDCEGTKELVGSHQSLTTNNACYNTKSLLIILLGMFAGLVIFLVTFVVVGGGGGGSPTVNVNLTVIPTSVSRSTSQNFITPDHQPDAVTGTPGMERGGLNTTPGSRQWYRQQMKRQRVEMRQTENCRPLKLSVPVSSFLSAKDQLLDMKFIPRYVALSRCPGWGGVCQGGKGWDGLCGSKGCCLPVPGPHPTTIIYIQAWNSTSSQLEDHTRVVEYHQKCVCFREKT